MFFETQCMAKIKQTGSVAIHPLVYL